MTNAARKMLTVIKIVILGFIIVVLFAGLFLYFYEVYVERSLKAIEKKENITQPSNFQSENYRLRLLTFNVWGLPMWLPNIDKVKRYKAIPDSILNVNADIVCLQESFDPKIRLRILRKMKFAKYFFNENYSCSKSSFLFIKKDCYGGLMTFSRYPILWEKFFTHKLQKGMKPDEEKGMKGFLISLVQSPIGELVIVNIHLYSGRTNADENIRLKQLKYFERVLDSLSISNLPTVIQGDLNVVHPSVIDNHWNDVKYQLSTTYKYLTTQMLFIDTKGIIEEKDITYDIQHNPYSAAFYYKKEGRQKFDYCLYRFPGGIIDFISSQIVFKSPYPISDHYGLLSEIKFIEH
jgi:endonuclease/exonuclease/phosphatase family metal-dependent hydrolase